MEWKRDAVLSCSPAPVAAEFQILSEQNLNKQALVSFERTSLEGVFSTGSTSRFWCQPETRPKHLFNSCLERAGAREGLFPLCKGMGSGGWFCPCDDMDLGRQAGQGARGFSLSPQLNDRCEAPLPSLAFLFYCQGIFRSGIFFLRLHCIFFS